MKLIKILSYGVISLSFIVGGLSYLVEPNDWTWSNLLLSLSVALFQLFLGLVIVNIYIKNTENRGLNAACLGIIGEGIALFHNHLLRVVINRFGREGYKKLVKEYHDNKRDANNIAEEKILYYIETIKSDYQSLLQEMDVCSGTLLQTSITGAFNGNPNHLTFALEAIRQNSIIKELDITNPNDYRKIFSCLENFDGLTQLLIHKVHQGTGSKESIDSVSDPDKK